MELRIQYTKIEDGGKIAYWTMGEGGTRDAIVHGWKG